MAITRPKWNLADHDARISLFSQHMSLHCAYARRVPPYAAVLVPERNGFEIWILRQGLAVIRAGINKAQSTPHPNTHRFADI